MVGVEGGYHVRVEVVEDLHDPVAQNLGPTPGLVVEGVDLEEGILGPVEEGVDLEEGTLDPVEGVVDPVVEDPVGEDPVPGPEEAPGRFREECQVPQDLGRQDLHSQLVGERGSKTLVEAPLIVAVTGIEA